MPHTNYEIMDIDGRLSVRFGKEVGLGDHCVDFADPTLLYRIQKGGGRSQAIAKAAGLKKGLLPSILDHTAGFGRDAFVLAALGCRVHMIEKSPPVHALLADGLRRAKEDPQIGAWVSERLSLREQPGDPLPFLPQTVYLDPMYPARKKSAAVKKELRILRELAGDEDLSVALFEDAMAQAAERVVIKRPGSAAFILPQKPDGIVETPNHRFEIYKRMTFDALK